AVERAVAAPTELAASSQVTQPESQRRAAYDSTYGIYRTLYPALRESMRLAQESGAVATR
ncbi:MAG: hypothetical protein V1772_06385, partial [Chloroflexota bacterium]